MSHDNITAADQEADSSSTDTTFTYAALDFLGAVLLFGLFYTFVYGFVIAGGALISRGLLQFKPVLFVLGVFVFSSGMAVYVEAFVNHGFTPVSRIPEAICEEFTSS